MIDFISLIGITTFTGLVAYVVVMIIENVRRQVVPPHNLLTASYGGKDISVARKASSSRLQPRNSPQVIAVYPRTRMSKAS